MEGCPLDRPAHLNRLLSLLLTVSGSRGGALITDPSDAAARCGRLLSAAPLPEPAGAAAADLAACILSGENVRMPAWDAVKLVKQVRLRGCLGYGLGDVNVC